MFNREAIETLRAKVRSLESLVEVLWQEGKSSHRLRPSEYGAFKEMERRAFSCLHCHDEGGEVSRILTCDGHWKPREGFCSKCGKEFSPLKKKK